MNGLVASSTASLPLQLSALLWLAAAAACGSDEADDDSFGASGGRPGAGGSSAGLGGSFGVGGATGLGGGSATGGSAAGGAGGFTPNPACSDVPAVDGEVVIDDLEDGDAIASFGNRRGDWFAYNDGSSGQVPMPFQPTVGGPSGSLYAAQTAGAKFTIWGAGIGVALNQREALSCSYDASSCEGIRFWAKSSSAPPDVVRFRVATEKTTPFIEGGSCPPPDSGCNLHHQVQITLTDTWTEYVVRWNELIQPTQPGIRVPFEPRALVRLYWQVAPNVSFGFGVDGIEFVGCRPPDGVGGAAGSAGAGGSAGAPGSAGAAGAGGAAGSVGVSDGDPPTPGAGGAAGSP